MISCTRLSTSLLLESITSSALRQRRHCKTLNCSKPLVHNVGASMQDDSMMGPLRLVTLPASKRTRLMAGAEPATPVVASSQKASEAVCCAFAYQGCKKHRTRGPSAPGPARCGAPASHTVPAAGLVSWCSDALPAMHRACLPNTSSCKSQTPKSHGRILERRTAAAGGIAGQIPSSMMLINFECSRCSGVRVQGARG